MLDFFSEAGVESPFSFWLLICCLWLARTFAPSRQRSGSEFIWVVARPWWSKFVAGSWFVMALMVHLTWAFSVDSKIDSGL